MTNVLDPVADPVVDPALELVVDLEIDIIAEQVNVIMNAKAEIITEIDPVHASVVAPDPDLNLLIETSHVSDVDLDLALYLVRLRVNVNIAEEIFIIARTIYRLLLTF